MIDFANIPFRQGTVISLQKGQVNAFDFASMPTGKALVFTQAYIENVMTNMRLPEFSPLHLVSNHTPSLQLNHNDLSRFLVLLSQIDAELKAKNSDPLIVMYLFSALTLFHKRFEHQYDAASLTASQRRIFSRFSSLLEKNCNVSRDANWYAEQLSTTYKTLNQVVKKSTELSAKQMIDAYTVIEMKRRLALTQVTSKELAYDFNFDDQSNFIKYFKKLTGNTPHAFRQQYLKTYGPACE
ncbi:AraC family transcriptional regulator [Veronia nyctiphanis]|nr:helix-turn-helix domain-containing protein [Veronia nyctiphanis]